MGKLGGFLQIERRGVPYRDAHERARHAAVVRERVAPVAQDPDRVLLLEVVLKGFLAGREQVVEREVRDVPGRPQVARFARRLVGIEQSGGGENLIIESAFQTAS